jgi:hypothetical protein
MTRVDNILPTSGTFFEKNFIIICICITVAPYSYVLENVIQRCIDSTSPRVPSCFCSI